MAEVVLRAQLGQAGLAGRVVVDSAGTGDWHVGERMHPPARKQLRHSGYDGSAHRARQFDASWFAGRDLILAMDHGNLATLRALARRARVGYADASRRIRLFGEVAGLDDADVPDPYGGSDAEFALVLAMLEAGMANLAGRLRAVAGAPATER
jgi:protein-tyrosine phosphatase